MRWPPEMVMAIKSFLAVCVVSAASLTAAAVPAEAGQAGGAQAPQAPPTGTSGQAPRALFGGGVGSVGQTLTGNLSLGGGAFRREVDPAVDPLATPTESSIGYLSGGLFYQLDGGRGNLSADYAGYGNYYAALSDKVLVGHRGNVGASFRFSNRTAVSGSQGVYYYPPISRSLQGIFGSGQGGSGRLPEEIDPGAIEERSLSYYTRVGLRQVVTSRSDLSLTYAHRRTDFRTGSDSPDSFDELQVSDYASIRYNHRIGEYLRVWGGYRYETSEVGDDPDAPRTETSGWDVGLDLSRDFAVELTETTTLSFGAGTTVARRGDDTKFIVTGDVLLSQRIRRSGSANVYYRRSANFVEGITEIVIADSVGGQIGGSPSRRVNLSAHADYRRGNIGLENRNSIRATNAGARMSIALAREVGLGFNYSYVRSTAANAEFLLTPELRDFDGHRVSTSIGWRYLQFGVNYLRYYYQSRNDQSVTGFVSLYAPLVARTRRSDAAR